MPLRGGGVLSVIGDVSGKGIPAAMTVSLLVGTVRTLAHYTQSPAEILAAMNQRMLARTHDGGFTTCLILRADRTAKLPRPMPGIWLRI
jgi:serine phosphatase RsbU (regulator of sigma subunit)